jgi:hypothetical protein
MTTPYRTPPPPDPVPRWSLRAWILFTCSVVFVGISYPIAIRLLGTGLGVYIVSASIVSSFAFIFGRASTHTSMPAERIGVFDTCPGCGAVAIRVTTEGMRYATRDQRAWSAAAKHGDGRNGWVASPVLCVPCPRHCATTETHVHQRCDECSARWIAQREAA